MEKRLTIPNLLSGLRIITIPIIVLLILNSNSKNYPILIGLCLISLALDFFDGFLARKLKQESELGKLLDPIADKLMVFGVIGALVINANFPLWLAIVIVARDLLILVAGSILFRGKHIITPSVMVGKVTFALLGTLMLVYIVDLSQAIDLEILKRYFIVSTISFLIWSLMEYYEVYLRVKNA